MDKTLKYDNPDTEGKFDKSKLQVKVLRESITLVMNGTSVATRCYHRVLRIE